MDRGDIAHITLWFLSNYSLLDFMDEKRFIEIYKREIGSSRRQLQHAPEIRRELLKVATTVYKPKARLEAPEIKEKKEYIEFIEKPKEKEYIEIEEKPSIVIEEKPSIILEEKPIMKEKIKEVKPSLGQRIRSFIKRIFRI